MPHGSGKPASAGDPATTAAAGKPSAGRGDGDGAGDDATKPAASEEGGTAGPAASGAAPPPSSGEPDASGAPSAADDARGQGGRVETIVVPPGRRQLGLAVEFLSHGGAKVTRVDPSCEFRYRIVPGDVLMTVDGNVVRGVGDISKGSGGTRRLEFALRRPGNFRGNGAAAAAMGGSGHPSVRGGYPSLVTALAMQYLKSGTNPVTNTTLDGTVQASAQAGSDNDGLPEGWGARVTWSGRTYYFNKSTNETSWTKPVKEPSNGRKRGRDASEKNTTQQPKQARKTADASTPSTGARVTTRSSAQKIVTSAKDDAAEPPASFSLQLEEVAAAAAGDGGTMRTRRRAYQRPSPPEKKRAPTQEQKKWSTYTDSVSGRKYYWDGNAVTWKRPKELGPDVKSVSEVTAAGARLAAAAPRPSHKPKPTSAPLKGTFDFDVYKKMREESLRSLEEHPDATDHDKERAEYGIKVGVEGPVYCPSGRLPTYALLEEAGGTGTDVRSVRRRDVLLGQIIHFNKKAIGENNNCYSDTKVDIMNTKYSVILVPTDRVGRRKRKDDGRGRTKAEIDNEAFRAYNKRAKCLDRFLEGWAGYIGGTEKEAARMVCHALARAYPEEYLGEVATANKYKPTDGFESEEPPPGYVCYDGSSPEVKANVQWNLMYAELLKWKEEHGHPNVPAKSGEKKSELVKFVHRMRAKKDGLSETRLRLLNDIGFKWHGEFGKKLPVPGGDPRVNRMVAAKIVFPELSSRECMYLGGYEDEELDKIKGPQKWRTIYSVLKDQLRNIVSKFDSRSYKKKMHLNRKELVDILRGDDPDRLTKVFGERAGLFEGFMEKAAERKREGIDPDDHRASRRRKGDGRKQEGCEREGAQDEHDMAMEEDEEASDMEAHNEYEQDDPDQEAHDVDERHQQHLDNWQPDYPQYQYDDL